MKVEHQDGKCCECGEVKAGFTLKDGKKFILRQTCYECYDPNGILPVLGIDLNAAWVVCDMCKEECYCRIHDCHAGNVMDGCTCPEIEEWEVAGIDPFTEGYPDGFKGAAPCDPS